MEIISSRGIQGHLAMVLHAHLPFTRCPEQEHCLEETWLYEAITESYIPLLSTFEDLLNDKVDFRITISLSPTLIAMLSDSLLRTRYATYLDRLIALSADEIVRTRTDMHLSPLSRMYHSLLLKVRHLYNDVYRRDLGAAFGALAASGRVELITSTATHAYLPALLSEPASVRAQLLTGADYFRGVFGSPPPGLWLPECGFAPEIDRQLRDAGVSFFFLESHGLLDPVPSGEKSIYAPARTPSGAVAFARDVDSARQVWSSSGGYPGDSDYRDFYRDIGFDLEFDRLREYLPHGVRTFTGLKYYRITGATDHKQPYLPEKAAAKAAAHARDFLKKKEEQAASLHRTMRIKPCITAAYDAELFGHWWFEGPQWLRAFLTCAASNSAKIGLINPSAYIAENPGIETIMPAMSSWGEKGYSATWIDSSNDWIYRHITHASRRMTALASQHHNASGLMRRALNQAGRELLLSQSSDWAFMMKTGHAAEFARNRFIEHIENFLWLSRGIERGEVRPDLLQRLEDKNCLFPDIDFRVFSREAG